MIAHKIKHIWEALQSRNYKSFYLAFCRLALSAWLLKELLFNWNSRQLLYGQDALVSPLDYGTNKVLLVDLHFFREHATVFLLAYALLLLFNMAGVGKWLTALLVFFFVDFLQKQNIYLFSGGERMARLMLLYLVFADSYEYLSFRRYQFTNTALQRFSNLLSNLASLSIMLQLCLAYLASGLSKLDSNIWRKGLATYYIFQLDSYQGTRWNVWLAHQKWFPWISNYFTLAFELIFPFVIWIKRARKPLLIIGVLFHLGIYLLMMIYGFQLIFILCYGFFIPNNTWLRLYHTIRSKFFSQNNPL